MTEGSKGGGGTGKGIPRGRKFAGYPPTSGLKKIATWGCLDSSKFRLPIFKDL